MSDHFQREVDGPGPSGEVRGEDLPPLAFEGEQQVGVGLQAARAKLL